MDYRVLHPGRVSPAALILILAALGGAAGCNRDENPAPPTPSLSEAAPGSDSSPIEGGSSSSVASSGPAAPQADSDAADPAQTEPPPAASNADQPDSPVPTPSPADEDPRPEDPPAGTGPEPRPEAAELTHPFPKHIPAPDLVGGEAWINTGGPIELADLRGKFVILDFWTYCCINCMHILPELKKLEKAYPNNLVVIGVHSAKFLTEEDTGNIQEAVLRYDIEHPVVNDARHRIWDQYQVSSWPSLRVIDPEGNLVAGDSGEIPFEVLDAFLTRSLPYYRAKGLLDERPLHFDLAHYSAEPTPLRFPGKVLADEATNRLFIADSNHHRIVAATLDGKLIRVFGSGSEGNQDGPAEKAAFDHPQGMALKGETLYVADTENHLLRKIDLATGDVSTIAGTGKKSEFPWPGIDLESEEPLAAPPKRYVGPPLSTSLASPWDLHVRGEDLFIAMAGPHQIWRMKLDGSEIGPFAGNGREDIIDGPLLPAWPREDGFASFAQPSGLTSDGVEMFVADSEGSSIRAVPFDESGEVRTVLGTAHLPEGRLFVFGDRDGQGKEVLLQHPLGVAYADGKVFVADSYNNKIKEIDLASESCRTLAGSGEAGSADSPPEFDEPAGLSIAGSRLYVADTNNHAIRVIDLASPSKAATLVIEGLAPPERPVADSSVASVWAGAQQVAVDPVEVKPADGKIELNVRLNLPPGYKINPLAPMRFRVDFAKESGIVRRDGFTGPIKLDVPTTEFAVPLPVSSEEGQDELRLYVNYFYCREGAEGTCRTGSVAWNVSIRVSKGASENQIPLSLTVE